MSILHSSHHTLETKNCVVIENFVTYSDYNNEIEKKYSQFLYVGRLTNEKGFLDLLNATVILKKGGIKCKFHIIGLAATEQQEKEVMDFIDNNKLREYFILYGAVFGKDKLELFKKSKVFNFPKPFRKLTSSAKRSYCCEDGDCSFKYSS